MEVTLARAVLQQHLEQCQFPLVRIGCFTEILRFPCVFLQTSKPWFFNAMMEFSSRKSGRCWTEIFVCAETISRLWRRPVDTKLWTYARGISAAGLPGPHCLWCRHKPLVWPSPEVECWEWPFLYLPILLCIYSLGKMFHCRKPVKITCLYIQTEK